MPSEGHDAAVTFENPLEDPLIRRLAAVVIIGSFMSVLDTTIVNVAIETLSRDFGSPISTIQWVTTGYLLALALVIPMSGWVVERFGSRRMFVVSLVLFTLGSALCGLAWSTPSLIAFRFLQGLGGGMLMPIGQTVLARAAGPQRMGRMMSVIGVPTLLAPVIGPVLGGLIVDNFELALDLLRQRSDRRAGHRSLAAMAARRGPGRGESVSTWSAWHFSHPGSPRSSTASRRRA